MDRDEYHRVRGGHERQDVVRLDATTNREGLSQSPNQQEELKMKTQWTGRVVTDTRSDAGAIILDDESTAYDDLKTWVMDYYTVDEADVEIAAEHLYAAAHEN